MQGLMTAFKRGKLSLPPTVQRTMSGDVLKDIVKKKTEGFKPREQVTSKHACEGAYMALRLKFIAQGDDIPPFKIEELLSTVDEETQQMIKAFVEVRRKDKTTEVDLNESFWKLIDGAL